MIGAARLTCGLAAVAAAGVAAGGQETKPLEPRTLTYASRGGADLLLDLYLPANPIRRPIPVIVFLHGGGWSGGTRTTGPDFRRYFAQDGFAIASLEYRLTPAITFPANVEDVRTAVRWLKANAATHGLAADRICLWGTSAGGHLAAVAGLAPPGTFEGADNLDQTSAVRCVLDGYGPTRFDRMDAQTEQERATLQPAVVTINVGGGPGGARGARRAPARSRAWRASRTCRRRRPPLGAARRPGVAGVTPRRRRRADRSGSRAGGQSADICQQECAAVPDHARPRGQFGAAWPECSAVRER